MRHIRTVSKDLPAVAKEECYECVPRKIYEKGMTQEEAVSACTWKGACPKGG